MLKNFEIQSNGLKSIDEIQGADLPELANLNLQYNQLKILPIFNLPELEVLNLVRNQLEDIENLEKSYLPKIRKIMIKSNKIQRLPSLSFPTLEEFIPCDNCVTET